MAKNAPPKQRRQAAPSRSSEPDLATTEAASWATTRSGAISARGYQFQHAAGAFLAAQIADGTIIGALVPEGLDDMGIEASEPTHAQIKSRRPDQGPFSASKAAEHITDAWRAGQSKVPAPARQWLILEGTVDTTETLDDLTVPLGVVLTDGSPLAEALQRRVPKHVTADQLTALLDTTSVMCATWTQIEDQTDTHLRNLPSLDDRAGRHLVARSLVVEIANATAANATPLLREKVAFDRTHLIDHITGIAELIDVDGLNEAIRTGLCAPLDWTVAAGSGDRFYEGESAQPGHVAAGLVVERPDLLAQVSAGMETNRPVILTGPSGVGKSAAMWTVPRAHPGTTWFRVHRLESDDDANLLTRLARAYRATPDRPVGFLVDGAGTGLVTGWPHASARAAIQDGVLLLGTARNEDLIQLGSLAGSVTVDVGLDETAAAAIHAGLARRGATTAPHWAEAYEDAHGLTLEFTHILTQGRRLHDVIADQITDRIRDGRHTELAVVGLVAVAHQWGAGISLSEVIRVLEAEAGTLRKATERLVNEHLIAEADGILTGLHPVRSAAISTSVHATPPPLLVDTVSDVLRAIDDRQLPTFISAALRDCPDLVDTVIAAGAAEPTNARRLAGYLQGLRLADASDAIRQWIEIVSTVGVKRSNQMTVVMFALSGTDFGDLTPDTIRTALEQIGQVPLGHRRDDLADRVGADTIARLVADAGVRDASAVIATLHGWATPLVLPTDSHGGALLRELSDAPLSVVDEIVSTFHDYDPALGLDLIARLGGADRMRELLQQDPWVLSLALDDEPGGPVAYARLLHLDSDAQGEPRQRCVAFARSLCRLLPEIDHPDVDVLLPGGYPYEYDGHQLARSALQREYDHNQTEIAWNQARTEIAAALCGESDSTRLAAAAPALHDLVPWLQTFVGRWLRQDPAGPRDVKLHAEAVRLDNAGYSLPPTRGRTTINVGAITETVKTSMLDPVSTTITDTTSLFLRLREVTNPAGEAMYVRDQIIKYANESLNEPWHLIVNGEQAIADLTALVTLCEYLATILVAIANVPSATGPIRRAATQGSAASAARRAATTARRLHDGWVDDRCRAIADALESVVGAWPVEIRSDHDDGWTRFAIAIEVPSLFEYVARQADIVEVVQTQNRTMDQFIVVPTRNGRRFNLLGQHIIINATPVLRSEGWDHLLPELHPHDLDDRLRASYDALTALSGVADVKVEQREHPAVAALVDDNLTKIRASISELTGTDDDLAHEIARDLVEIATRVETEINDPDGSETFAAAMSKGLLGQESDEQTHFGFTRLCALTWPVDPDEIRDLFASDSPNPATEDD